MNRQQRRALASQQRSAKDSSSELLAQALQLHRQGQLDSAESLYRRALQRNSRQIEALHFLGVLTSQRGRHAEAAEWIGQALDVDPRYADAWNNLGNVLAALDRWDEAADAYRRASELAPDNPSARCNQGVMLLRSQRFAEAVAAFQQAIALAPALVEAHFNLGKALAAEGQHESAVIAYREAVRLQPNHAMAYKSLGLLLYKLNRNDEASELFRDWLARDPTHPVARHMLAAHSGQDVPERAADGYVRQVFDDMADSFDEHLHRLEYRAPELIASAVAAQIWPGWLAQRAGCRLRHRALRSAAAPLCRSVGRSGSVAAHDRAGADPWGLRRIGRRRIDRFSDGPSGGLRSDRVRRHLDLFRPTGTGADRCRGRFTRGRLAGVHRGTGC